MTDHYAELGVGKNANKDEIRRAYRKKAQKGHPDKGGDKDKFYAIQKAYAVLSDDVRRSRYDLGGDDADTPDITSQALQHIGNLFLQIIEQADVDHTNIVEDMRRSVEATRGKDKADISIIRKAIVKREKAMKRIKCKAKGQNMLEAMLLGDIDARKRNIASMESRLPLYEEMLKILAEYEYKADAQSGQVLRRGGFMGVGQWT